MNDLKPGARFDLHLHTDRSDGRYEAGEVLERAAEAGLDVVALTDHDFPTQLDPGPQQLGSRIVRLIAGAELSGVHDGKEQHLLIYFPHEVPTPVRDFCQGQLHHRADRFDAAIDALGIEGLPPASEEARRGERALTRLHLAQDLVEHGHADSVPDAFSRFLGHRHGHVPAIETPFVEAIRMARAHGGVTSWAHPSARDAQAYLADFVAAGLQGLELYRPRLRRRERNTLRRLARAHGLYLTGGSDWHGWDRDGDFGLFTVRKHELRAFLDALDQAA